MNMRAEARLEMLNGLLDTSSNPNIGRVPTAYTTYAKQDLYDKIKAERGEGVVFKKGDSKYVPGRPNSGGNQLKYKFVSSTTLRVVAINAGKRSVQVEASVPDGFQSVGNVTIPTNFSVPTVGSLVEIRYLYFFREGSLFQPVYLGPRTDVDCADAVDSLKVKQEIDDDIA
jgi:bifunctional non-homologous end joining protein LigD